MRFPKIPCIAAIALPCAGAATTISNGRVIHLNHAGSSPSPPRVVDRIVEHLRLEQQLGGYAAAEAVQPELEGVYQKAATLVNACDPGEIALVESATVGWTRLFYPMAKYQDRKRRRGERRIILTCEAEYAANLVAAVTWAREHEGWSVIALPSGRNQDGSSTGIIDLEALNDIFEGKHSEQNLDPRNIALICVTHVPTNSGIVNPVEEIGKEVAAWNQCADSKENILYLVDACQSIGQRVVDVQRIQCHGLVATGRKYLRGPRGTGFLYSCNSLKQLVLPDHVDHFSVPIKSVPDSIRRLTEIDKILEVSVKENARRFEFWESSIANKLGLGEALSTAMEYGIERISLEVEQKAKKLFETLSENSEIQLHYTPQAGIVTFFVKDVDSVMIQQSLWREDSSGMRFELGVVPLTSTPLDSSNSRVPNLVRASVSYMNEDKEVELFCKRLFRPER